MCSKHSECCSTKHSQPAQRNDSCCHSSPKILSIRPMGTSSSESHVGATCSTDSLAGDSGGDEDPARHLGKYQSSWRVVGMDCPSCARKVETAVNQLTDIVSAKVVFSTEKLVVEYNQPATEQAIESVVQRTGYDVHNLNQATHSHKSENMRWYRQRDTQQIIAIGIGILFGALIGNWHRELGQWVDVIVCIAGLLPIAKSALRGAQSGSPFTIETLMTVACLGALYLGAYTEAAMVIFLFLIGERLEGFAAEKARSGVQSLMKLLPEQATKIIDGQRINVEVASLNLGDVIEVSPGGRLPADGILLTTAAAIDESALTGESVPAERQQGESLSAGGVVVDQVIQVCVTSRQGENAIDRILHMIEDAESRKAPLERFLDKFSRWYTPMMMGVALAVVLIPPLIFSQPWDTWLYRGLATLLIACPCALVISTPAAITSGLATAARYGALIKGGAALEQLGRIKTIAFDKTGTLTQGQPQVTDVITLGKETEEKILQYAAAIEQGSVHPLAKALVNYVADKGIPLPEADNKSAQAGKGVSGVVNGQKVQLLAPRHSHLVDEHAQSIVERLELQGKTVVYLQIASEVVGIISWQDQLRDDAQKAVRKLTSMGVSSVMLTGDNQRCAAGMAEQLNLEYQAQLLPADKVDWVRNMAQQGHVAMVGDGINDAPAMKSASVAIAMGEGSDVALETADAALTHNRLSGIPTMIALSQATLANIRQNITLALGLKAIFLVTSLCGITGLWLAVLADSGATALVTLNALRLLRFKAED